VDRSELSHFLRRRRAALRPEDVGLHRGPRQRAPGLRREDVAQLAGMSTDYYARIEQQRGPQPSEQMLGAISRAMRLTTRERDHLLRLAGHTPPPDDRPSAHVGPALLHALDRLDTPAQVVDDLGRTLAQNPLAKALNGDHSTHTGLARSIYHRWFTDPDERRRYPEDEWPARARAFVADLRTTVAKRPDDPDAAAIVHDLSSRSAEFRRLWDAHDLAGPKTTVKRKVHPTVGPITLECQTLTSDGDGHALLIYTATPGSEDQEKLDLLRVIGTQTFAGPA
jgi:transcriptional regulator with XRE-family HTH domain